MRHTLRLFTRTPLATAAALGALTLAIGASTLVFSVVNGVLLRDLPVPRPVFAGRDLGDQPAPREHDQRRIARRTSSTGATASIRSSISRPHP